MKLIGHKLRITTNGFTKVRVKLVIGGSIFNNKDFQMDAQ